jgi:hypothetical protein
MGDEQVKEASWVVQSVTGASAYLHGVGYDKQTIKQEIAAAVEHIKKSA